MTEAGTVAAEVLELDSETDTPPLPAADVRVTVPVAEPPLAIVLELTERLLSATAGGFTVIPNVVLAPEYDAVRVTGVVEPTVIAAAVKVVEVWPCGTVTVEGTVASAGDAVMPIVAPPVKAADVNETVQVVEDNTVIVVALHVRLLNPGLCGIVTVPPVTEVAMLFPIVSAANPPDNCSDEEVLVVEDERVSVTVPSTPLGITVLFRPHTRQVMVPGPEVQDNVLPVSDDPDAKLADEKSVVE